MIYFSRFLRWSIFGGFSVLESLGNLPQSVFFADSSMQIMWFHFLGHTHGGQMFPLTIFIYLANPFFLGLYDYNGGQVYVSEGTVFWGVPMRIGTGMEITHISLHPR